MDALYHGTVEPVLLCRPEGAAQPEPLTAALHRVPKLDFHCHLNGSVSAPLLAHLERLTLHGGDADDGGCLKVNSDASAGHDRDASDEAGHILFFNSQEKRTLNVLTASPTSASGGEAGPAATPADRMHYCFSVFGAIYKVLTNLAFTRLAVQDMLLTSAAENIFVMEIRTSMRDGVRRGFRAPAAGGKDGDDAVVTKQMYVDTVIETVEHVLAGGLVDFATGELMSAEASAAVLSAGARPAAAAAAGASTLSAWWRVYERVYRTVLQPTSPPPPHDVGSASPERDDPNAALRRHFLNFIHPSLTQRMHVRLLLSVNRGAPVSAAWEAARLTTLTQQRQVKEFHAWCSTHAPPSLVADANMSRVLHHRLRTTCWVTGMDFSGNCYNGRYAELEPALAAARAGKIDDGCDEDEDEDEDDNSNKASTDAVKGKDPSDDAGLVPVRAAITLHAGEKQDAQELGEMIAFAPERWGHLVFTDPANLTSILTAQQGIELCLTSNLLTSGHSDVVDHHLGDLLELWDSQAESHTRDGTVVGGPYPCYAATERVRLAHRQARAARRWGGVPASCAGADDAAAPAHATGDGSADGPLTYVLPNISFHTDDRGVFGTTLSQELQLAATHPSIVELCTVLRQQQQRAGDAPAPAPADTNTALVHFFWLFERLALLQVFELPLPVQLMAAAVLHDAPGSPESASAKSVLTACEGWRDWATYARLCSSLSATAASADVAAQLSRWEWAWLTACFDRYYV